MADENDEPTLRDAAGDAPDLQALAREYLDLWRRQLAATASDEALAKTMADAVRLMNAGAAQVAMQMGRAGTGPANDGADAHDDGTTFGSETAGASHRDDDRVFRQFARRIDELEERIGVLETRTQDQGGRPRGRR